MITLNAYGRWRLQANRVAFEEIQHLHSADGVGIADHQATHLASARAMQATNAMLLTTANAITLRTKRPPDKIPQQPVDHA